MKKIISCVLVSIFVSINVYAQGSATGCLLPSTNRVYTTQGLLGAYANTPSVGLSPNYCSWTPTSSTGCNVCTAGFDLAGLCLGTLLPGTRGTFTMVPCSLDEKTPFIVVVSCLVGIVFLRRRRKIADATC